MRYGLKGKARTRPDFFQGGFGSMRTNKFEPISAKYLAKIWPKWTQKCLEA